MNDPTAHDWDLALAKFAVIAPLVCRQLSPAEEQELRREILAATHQFPNGKLCRLAPRTLRRWCQLYRQHNLVGLVRHPRRDRGLLRTLPMEVLEQAKALRAELPSRSARTISDLLAVPGTTPISPSTLAYHLRTAERPAAATATDKAFRRFEHPRPNSCWQSDLSDGLWLPDPVDPARQRKCYLHAFLDDHSRLVPQAAFYWRESLPALLDCFRQAVTQFGLPSILYWDNGSPFRAQQMRRMAARLQIEIVFSTPYAPEGRGKIERFFGVVKAIFYPEAQAAGLTTLAELNRFFAAWLDTHYQRKVHSETGQTPRDRWEAGREHIRFATPEDLADVFLWEEERSVRKTGTISLAGNHYPVEARLVGQTVTVRFDPFDLRQIQVVVRGQVVGTASPQELVARTYSKAQPTPKPATPQLLASSRAFKDRLVEQADQVQRQWGELLPAESGCLTASEFGAHVIALLGANRTLVPEETARLNEFWQRQAPLRATVTVRALTDAITAKGTERHLDYYLEAIRQAHWGGR